MQVFFRPGGPFLGFYRELGSPVRIVRTRKVVKRVQVWHTEDIPTVIEGELVHTSLPIEGHYETRSFLVPEQQVQKSRIVEEHYEEKMVTEPAHWGTREYWLEPHIEIRYRFVGTEEQRAGRAGWEQVEGEWVFVGTAEQRAGRAGWEAYEVEIPGCWVERRIWFPEVTRMQKVLVREHLEYYTETIPEHEETREVWVDAYVKHIAVRRPDKTVMVKTTWWDWEEKEVDDPVYAYANYPDTDYLKLLSHTRGAVWPPAEAWDTLEIKILATGDVYTTSAEYIGFATRIGENEFVIP